MAEVRAIHSHISGLESALGAAPPNVELLAIRGLFYVQLYGVFEFAINAGVQQFLRSVKALNVQHVHLELRACTYSLDQFFSSISSGKGKKVFGKRIELLEKQRSADLVDMPDSLFAMSLQNIDAAAFESVFEWLGLSSPAFPATLIKFRGYIDEIVEKRRKVAHGRESASVVGQGTRSPELTSRMDAVAGCVEHLFTTLEAHLAGRAFVLPAHRAAYP